MTIEEFDNTRFGAGDKAKYKDGKVYKIQSVDFDEKLICLTVPYCEDGSWVRCENIDFIPKPVK